MTGDPAAPGGLVPASSTAPASVADGDVWIDLVEPSAEEQRRVEQALGIAVPSREALSEVEMSSRLRRSGDALILSTPMITADGFEYKITPLGFVLTKSHLVTVRFHDLRCFASARERIRNGEDDARTSSGVFVVILEEIVDSLADHLEDLSSDLDGLASRIFAFDAGARPGARKGDETAPKRRDLALRRLLRAIGRYRKSLTRIRASLLGLERITGYAKSELEEALPEDLARRIETAGRDIASLEEFETRLTETLQFLLDATLGLINIEQNSVFRILTVVSVVGVPPTLIASIYGMNFERMPELKWAFGYPMGLALIIVSGLIPLWFFRNKGWI